ncbi:hypothetical protein Micbo1qcDRAFT_214614 [Microdochium bolleyi]|uniref:Hypersensitive response-inducing protein n=1 Tax=Microdochium bolleyi TaxID=196109 RepID=A0A136ITH2_9PEZI|nr:hypothetical protein Micbo1qcDRAFT_214614 [Microdochium bolleyi]
MKFSAATLFAATAAAAAVKRQSEFPVYEVSNFVAQCVSHSTQCIYSFTVIRSGTGETTGASCRATATAENGNLLPELEGGVCELSSRTFSVSRNDQGLELSISAPISPISDSVGVHQILDSELEVVTPENPNGAYQVYRGPQEFKFFTPESS